MLHDSWVRGYRIAFAVLTFVAVAYQYTARAALGNFNPVNFFSFFTIQSNLFAATVFLLGGLRGEREEGSRRWGLLRGAAVAYMTTTFVVYGLLRSAWEAGPLSDLPVEVAGEPPEIFRSP